MFLDQSALKYIIQTDTSKEVTSSHLICLLHLQAKETGISRCFLEGLTHTLYPTLQPTKAIGITSNGHFH